MTIKPEVITAISSFLEIMRGGSEVFIVARMTPESLDELAIAGAELDDIEDSGLFEPGDEGII